VYLCLCLARDAALSDLLLVFLKKPFGVESFARALPMQALGMAGDKLIVRREITDVLQVFVLSA